MEASAGNMTNPLHVVWYVSDYMLFREAITPANVSGVDNKLRELTMRFVRKGQQFFRAMIVTVVTGISCAGTSVSAGEGFFEKIGDGPRHAVEGLVQHPQRIFPVCWGSDRCDDPAKPAPTTVATPSFTVTFRVDCKDAVTGADRADNPITVTLDGSSIDDARNRRWSAAVPVVGLMSG